MILWPNPDKLTGKNNFFVTADKEEFELIKKNGWFKGHNVYLYDQSRKGRWVIDPKAPKV